MKVTMKAALCFFFGLWAVTATASGQSDTASAESRGLQYLADYIGLKPGDIAFRADYTEVDSMRLKLVADLMQRPLGMTAYASALKQARAKGQPEILGAVLFSDLALERQIGRRGAYEPSADELQSQYNLAYTDLSLNQLLTRAATYIDVVIPRSTQAALAPLSAAQRAFLTDELRQVIAMDEQEEFLPLEALDSLEKVEEGYIERFVAFAGAIDKDPILAAGLDCLRQMLQEVKAVQTAVRASSAEQMMQTSGYLPADLNKESYLGWQTGWMVGGGGNDYYKGDYRFILDFGGDDVYDLSFDRLHPHPVIIIDLDGNDSYRARTDFALGSGCLSVGLLLDFAGDDRYDARSFGLGSGWFGFGLLYDAAGHDRYDGDTHVQGAGTFGIGLLVDEEGRDSYQAALHAQGFGFVQGAGVLFDLSGSDNYFAGGKYKDILRYEDHYLSMSQGFGYGFRPWVSGGLGAIIDLEGSDNYLADIFAQGSSYWWSLGLIYDSSGADNYYCYQYGQGSATHMTLGALIDDHGSDTYFGRGVMQGCGHDYAFGLLLDREGDDTYTGYDKVQAAGSANGIGLLMDLAGKDRYFASDPTFSRGSGDPRRGFGSLGLFLDLGGADQYFGRGGDNSFWRADRFWGGGVDVELPPADTSGGLP